MWSLNPSHSHSSEGGRGNLKLRANVCRPSSQGMPRCSSCGETLELCEGVTYTVRDHEYFRCCPCNSWGGRFSTAKKRMGAEDVEILKALAAEDKKSLMLDNRMLLGEGLKKSLEAYCEKVKTTRQINRFKSTARLLDQQDLEEKYAKKPQQLANILQAAPTYTCPTRKVDLWADPEYEIQKEDSADITTTQTVSAAAREDIKPKPKKKLKASPSAASDGGPHDKPKQAPAEKKRSQLREKYSLKVGAMKEMLASASEEKFDGYIPATIISKAKLGIAGGDAAIASLDLSLSDGWSGDHDQVCKEAKVHMDELNIRRMQIKRALKIAEDMRSFEESDAVDDDKDVVDGDADAADTTTTTTKNQPPAKRTRKSSKHS